MQNSSSLSMVMLWIIWLSAIRVGSTVSFLSRQVNVEQELVNQSFSNTIQAGLGSSKEDLFEHVDRESSFCEVLIICAASSLCILACASLLLPGPTSTPCEHDSLAYRADIDGLRAVAVVLVVVFHWGQPWLSGGWIGVDIFYVISGYVVTGSLVRRNSLCSLDGLSQFYVSRIKRLMPNSLLTICVTGLLVCLFIPKWTIGWNDPLGNIETSGRYAALGAANILFGSSHQSYWSTGAESLELNPYTHMWSLGVEEQFYLLYPMLLFLLHRQAPTIKSLHASPIQSRTVLGICVALSLGANYVTVPANPTQRFYYLHYRFWELAIGGWLYEWQASFGDERWIGITTNRWCRIPCEFLAIALIGAAVFTPERPQMQELSMLVRTCTGVLGTVCCIVASTPSDGHLKRMLSANFLVYIGKASYSIYLWHWPIFTIFRWTIGLDSAMHMATSMLLTVGFALAAYHGIEKPVRKLSIPKWGVLLALLAGLCICQGWLFLLSHHKDFTAVPPLCQRSNGLLNGTSVSFRQPESRLRKDISTTASTKSKGLDICACVLNDAVQHIPPSAVALGTAPSLPACFAPEMRPAAVKPERTLLVIGDSHADAAYEAFKQVPAVQNLYHVRKLDKPCFGFTMLPKYYCYQYFPGFDPNLLDPNLLREQIFQEIKKFRSGDIVVLAQAAHLKVERELLERLQHAVQESHASLIFYGDNPSLNRGMTQCVPTWLKPDADSGCSTSVEDQKFRHHEFASFARNISNSLPSTYYFERWPLYCGVHTCDAFIPGTCTVAFTDKHHLSHAGKTYSAPFLCSFMEEHELL